jgi:hypothetical protein
VWGIFLLCLLSILSSGIMGGGGRCSAVTRGMVCDMASGDRKVGGEVVVGARERERNFVGFLDGGLNFFNRSPKP